MMKKPVATPDKAKVINICLAIRPDLVEKNVFSFSNNVFIASLYL